MEYGNEDSAGLVKHPLTRENDQINHLECKNNVPGREDTPPKKCDSE